MFPVTVTLHNPTQLNAVLAALSAGEIQSEQEATSAKKSSTSAKTPKANAPTQPTAGATGAAAPEPKGDDSAQAQGGNDTAEQAWSANEDHKTHPEYQRVAKSVVAVAKSKGRDAATALLQKVAGVTALPESKPSQADAIVTAFDAEV